MSLSLRYAEVAADVVSAVVSLILLYGNLFETHRKTVYGRVYSWMMGTIFTALLADGISWVLEGNAVYTVALYISNTISIVLTIILIAQFALYITSYIGERTEISRPLLKTALVFCSAAAIITTVLCACGVVFTIENGVFVTQPLYTLYSVASVIALLMSYTVVTKYRKVLGLHDSIAAYAYIAIPTVSAMINLWDENFSFTYPAITVAALILYVMIQSEQSVRLLEEKKISAYYAEHDELTGLFSRRAYVDRLESLRGSSENAGVVFCDLNGLKYTNDTIGHKEGDKLLNRFADLLRQYFRIDDIFRISGDEFVVIVEPIDEDEFRNRVRKFENALGSGEAQLACAGSGYGSAGNVAELIQKAEERMYERKQEFHRQYPQLRGGRPED